MTVQPETKLSRRHFARMLKSAMATTALASIVSMSGNVFAQTTARGCEHVAPSCGAEWADPSCGCESNILPSAQAAPAKPACYRPRSLSFAEKFLKQLDRIGDQVEWEAARKSSCATCSCVSASMSFGSGPTCGCETAYPNNGMGMPSCGCGPSVPFGMPNASSGVGSGVYASKPFSQQPIGAGQGGHSHSSPSAVPMFPNKPRDSQALGKITDHGSVAPKVEKPIAAPASPGTEQSSPALTDLAPTKDAKRGNEKTPPNTQKNSSDGLPQSPSALPPNPIEQGLPVLKPTPTEENSVHPSDSGEPSLPYGLPQSQDEIPDVLIDPFKDDARWKSNRYRMNGVRLTSAESANPLRPAVSGQKDPQPKLLPTPHNDESIGRDELPPVVVKPVVINRYRTNDGDSSPKVNRVAVPKKRD